MRRRALIAGVLAAAATVAGGSPAAAAPDCPSPPKARTVLQVSDILEAVLMDDRGRLFYSDQSAGALMRLDRAGAEPRRLADISGPGGIVDDRHGKLLVGYGDAGANGTTGDANPMSGVYRVGRENGAKSVVTDGFGMANGIALGPDGAIYGTNDFGTYVDRFKDGHVDHPWATVTSTNGIVVTPDNRYVLVAQTFQPAAIQRISVADPTKVSPYAVASGADMFAGLDEMSQDARGNLYVAGNGSGEVWRIDTAGRICTLATGIMNASDAALGTAAFARNVYVTSFGGKIVELAGAVPPGPGGRGAPVRSLLPAGGTAVGAIRYRRGTHGRAGRVRHSGVVALRRGRALVARQRVRAGRRYRFRAPPGRYRLSARSHGTRCRSRRVRLRAGRRTRADLVCTVR